MSTRISSLLVILEDDIRDEDAAKLQALFLMVRGVVAVTANESDPLAGVAEQRARHRLCSQMLEVLRP